MCMPPRRRYDPQKDAWEEMPLKLPDWNNFHVCARGRIAEQTGSPQNMSKYVHAYVV